MKRKKITQAQVKVSLITSLLLIPNLIFGANVDSGSSNYIYGDLNTIPINSNTNFIGGLNNTLTQQVNTSYIYGYGNRIYGGSEIKWVILWVETN